MKYAVVGLGAIGTIIGGILIKSQEDVILFAKKEQIDVIKKDGIEIIGINGLIKIKNNIKITNDFSKISDCDIILICVKSQDTIKLANDIKKYLKKTAIIISLQNGIKNAKKLYEITGINAISGVILLNALYLKVGIAEITIKGDILLENNQNFKDELKNFSKNLTNEGIKVIMVDEIDGYIWSKLIVNLQIAVTALTSQSIKESILDRDSREILIATMQEGLSILEKSNIKLKKLPDIDPIKTIERLKKYNTGFLKLGSRLMGIKENARNSMWQSLIRGKPTEIDFINGEIINLAEQNSLYAPINKKLVKLIKEAEKNHITRTIKPAELKKNLEL